MNVRLTKDQKITVLNTDDVYAIMQKILLRENKIRRNQEHFWIIGMDNQNKILFIELLSLGGINRVQIAPPEVFRMAIYKMATRAILVHNHPSGNALPSKPDLDLTNRMLKAGEIILVNVLDHLIITETEYISFDQLGFMRQLRSDDSFRVLGPDEAEIRALRTEVEKFEMKVEIAKKMMEDGLTIELIVKYTGLPKEDVKQILKEK